jgi:hypothetical protein
MDRIKELKRPLMLLVLLQICDLITTLVVLSLGGQEGNPVVQHFFARGPVFGLVATKVCVVVMGILLAYGGKRRGLRTANWVYTAVIIWNIFILIRLSTSQTA